MDQMVDDGAVDNMFAQLAEDGGEGYWSVVGRNMTTPLLENGNYVRLLPCEGHLPLV